MSKERGILFSAPMVRALLAGAKTQTRRAIQPAEPLRAMGSIVHTCNETATGGRLYTVRDRDGNAAWWFTRKDGDREQRQLRCPYGVPGDRLWVRETFRIVYGEARFRATCAEMKGETWRPSIFLPRKLSRITLEVTEIRVQRLQDISEEDAKAEGVEPDADCLTNRCRRPHFDRYMDLWDEINGKGSWQANPLVWAISFRRLP